MNTIWILMDFLSLIFGLLAAISIGVVVAKGQKRMIIITLLLLIIGFSLAIIPAYYGPETIDLDFTKLFY